MFTSFFVSLALLVAVPNQQGLILEAMKRNLKRSEGQGEVRGERSLKRTNV